MTGTEAQSDQLTQFGRELNIERICINVRLERTNKTLQDHLFKEMCL